MSLPSVPAAAALLALALSPGPAAAQQQPGTEPPAGIPAGLFTSDPARIVDERGGNAVVAATRTALARTGVLFAPEQTRELALREAALTALQRNLDVKRIGLNRSVVQRTLVEAEAVFDPVFILAANASLSNSFERIERPMQWKPATQEYVRGQQIPTGTRTDDIFLCGTMDDILSQPQELQTNFLRGRMIAPDASGRCHVRTLPSTAPVALVAFDKERVAGYYPFRKEASTRSPNGQTETYTGTAGVSQRLPWGGNLDLTVVTTYRDAYYVNNPDDPSTRVYGSYGRPWTSRATLSGSHPIPYTRNFREGDENRLAMDTARLNVDVADFAVRGVVNQTLLSVDTLYWTLVGAIQRLDAAAGSAALAEESAARVQRRMELGLASESNRGQVVAQMERLRAVQQQLFGDYLAASESLRELLDERDDALLLPIEYSAALDQPPEVPPASGEGAGRLAARVLDSPDYLRSETAVRIALRVREARDAQTRPDVTASGSLQVSQSNAVFGYPSVTESLGSLISYDSASFSIGVLYRRPIGNRAAKAALAGADHDVARQTHLLNQVERQIRGDYETARIQLASARQRIDDTARRLALARDLYDRAARLEAGGVVTIYETIERLGTLLEARLGHIQARIDARIAESRMLASIGALAERYGEGVAQTREDRERIALLRGTGALAAFGEPPR
ncbi:TolC family protein [Skermanella sp. TT6]|uniref:TolC family protein n=1 Tax=Skermanella cutis TaxID=2775420 RepID=A0ABX7BC04_9PROT|nr:TolC family protein [Skermanella sp. TT6]QQP91930.1 TolC family protein [Skermanella sp. TT6]